MSPAPDEEALRRLEQRLDEATRRAERLFSDAAAGGIPPSGWQRPGEQSPALPELELLLQLLGALRERVPSELQRRLADAVREVLLALRALIDWYLERGSTRAAEQPAVQDIPID